MKSFLQIRRLCVVIFTVGLFVMASRNVTDPDVWWHLRTGQLILQTHHVPRTDLYSFTRAGDLWIDHEWLSQVVIYGLLRIAGWGGLIVAFGMIVAAALMLIYLRSPGKPYIAALVTILGAFASAPCWGVRPQMFTFLFASIALPILEASRVRTRLLWWIPLLTLVWANLHAGYPLGIVFLILFALGSLLDVAFGFRAWNDQQPWFRTFIPVMLLSIITVAVNPYGATLYTYPFQTLHSRTMQLYISEWVSPDFHQARYAPFLLLIVATLILPAISPRRVRPSELLLVLVCTYAALRSVRHIPIYVVVAAPMVSALLESRIVQHLPGQRFAAQKLTPTKIAVNFLLLTGFATFVAMRLHFVIARQAHSESKHFPTAATEFIRANRPLGPMLNHYDWGGYLIWRLYPEYPVFIDGRADVYGDAQMDEFFSLYWVQGDWREVLYRKNIRFVLLPREAPLVTALRQIKGWKQIYTDDQAVIMALQP